MFEPLAVARLWSKCKQRSDEAQFSNADNMALLGVLSTLWLHQHFVVRRPEGVPVTPKTDIDRLERPRP